MALRIENAVDLHCHYGPDVIRPPDGWVAGGGVPAIDTARACADAGYAAIVLKSHSFGSAQLAVTIESFEPRLHVYGGVCTDYPTGGLNPAAVEAALALDTKVVWLPTGDGACDFTRRNAGTPREALGPVRVLDEDGNIVPAVHEIADLVRAADAILATGHITADEHYAVAKELAPTTKILVTHAGEDMAGPGLSAEQIGDLAELGAMIELSAMTCQAVESLSPGKPLPQMIELIRAAGPDRCTLSSDFGWSANLIPDPVPGLRNFLESLWDAGLTEDELQTMVSTNPGRLVSLDFN